MGALTTKCFGNNKSKHIGYNTVKIEHKSPSINQKSGNAPNKTCVSNQNKIDPAIPSTNIVRNNMQTITALDNLKSIVSNSAQTINTLDNLKSIKSSNGNNTINVESAKNVNNTINVESATNNNNDSHKIDKLNLQIISLTKEIKEIKEIKEELYNTMNITLNDKIDQLKESHSNDRKFHAETDKILHEDLADNNRRLLSLTEDNIDICSKIKDIKLDINLSEANTDKLKEDIDQLKVNNKKNTDKLKEYIVELKEDIVQLKAYIDQLKEDIVQLKANNKDIYSKIKDINLNDVNTDQLKSDIVELKANVDKLKENVDPNVINTLVELKANIDNNVDPNVFNTLVKCEQQNVSNFLSKPKN